MFSCHIIFRIFSLTQITIDTFKGFYSTAFFKNYCNDNIYITFKHYVSTRIKRYIMDNSICTIYINDIYYSSINVCIWFISWWK